MAENPYPIPRQLRQSSILVGDGGDTYGPFGFKIFDRTDVVVLVRAAGSPRFVDAEGLVVQKVGGDTVPFADFTIKFPAPLPVTTQYVVISARLAERVAGVRSGTRIDPDALEKEFSRIATQAQELRRDINRAWKSDPGQAGLTLDANVQDGETLMKQGDRLAAGPNIVLEAERAMEAADIAAGFASDIVSQGNVPIYSTINGMPSLEIPAGINAVRVNGKDSPGDGLGGLYIDQNNGSPVSFITADGRSWYFASEAPTTVTIGRPVAFQSVDGSTTPGFNIIGEGMIWRHISDGDPSNDTRALRVERAVDYAGGTAGYVNAGIDVHISILNSAYNSYEWSVLGRVDNYSNFGEPVGVYGQGNRRANNGAVWGGVMEVRDHTGLSDPQKGLIGLEVDVRASGTDANRNRVAIDVVLANMDVVDGDPLHVGYGIRVQNDGNSETVVGAAFSVNATCEIGFDAAAATALIAAMRMKEGQSIAFTADGLQQMFYDGIGLRYSSGGVNRVHLLGDGSISLNNNNVKIHGDNSVGGRAANLGANLPGTSSVNNPYRWIRATVGGVQGWIPFWRDAD